MTFFKLTFFLYVCTNIHLSYFLTIWRFLQCNSCVFFDRCRNIQYFAKSRISYVSIKAVKVLYCRKELWLPEAKGI